MRQYRHSIDREKKAYQYSRVIESLKQDGSYAKIKQAESLKGRITAVPTFTPKLFEIETFKTIDPILYHEQHKKLEQEVATIRNLKERIRAEGRSPMDAEVAEIAKYNERMMKSVHRMLSEVYNKHPQVRKITSIERGRMALEFIRMHEEPDKFMMHNRYLETAPVLLDEYTSSEDDTIKINDGSPFKYRKYALGSKQDLQKQGILPPTLTGREKRLEQQRQQSQVEPLSPSKKKFANIQSQYSQASLKLSD